MPHNKLVTQLNDSPASKLDVAAAAAAAGGDSWQPGRLLPHNPPSPVPRGQGQSLARIMMPHNKLATQLSDSPAYELAVAVAAAGVDSWQRGGWWRWPLRRQPDTVSGGKRSAGRAASSPHALSPTSRGQG